MWDSNPEKGGRVSGTEHAQNRTVDDVAVTVADVTTDTIEDEGDAGNVGIARRRPKPMIR